MLTSYCGFEFGEWIIRSLVLTINFSPPGWRIFFYTSLASRCLLPLPRAFHWLFFPNRIFVLRQSNLIDGDKGRPAKNLTSLFWGNLTWSNKTLLYFGPPIKISAPPWPHPRIFPNFSAKVNFYRDFPFNGILLFPGSSTSKYNSL